jgi:hypothetical protein
MIRFDRGIIDGKDHPFNQGTYSKCGDGYYEGYIEGCTFVDGNTADICERSTDK